MSSALEGGHAAVPATEAPTTSEKQIEAGDAAIVAPAEEKKKENLVTDEQILQTSSDQKEVPLVEQKVLLGDKAPVDDKATLEDKTAALTLDSQGPATTSPTAGESVWPETPADHPLTQFYNVFEELVKEANHSEVYGITLSKQKSFHTKLILQKFLRANSNDLSKAKEQLLDTLKWRKEFDPVQAAEASYDKNRFEGLGWIMELKGVPESLNEIDIVTFNIYGAVKDNKKTFGDLDGFLRWRVGLMERSVQKLNLATATEAIPNFGEGPDPYQGYQIHDYLQVSFIRQDPTVKAASKKTIETLGRYYPETLSRKFFVNVPVLMGWMYTAMKLFVAKETMKKFTVMSYGNQLAAELGPGTPKEYGGTAGELKEVGEGMQLEG